MLLSLTKMNAPMIYFSIVTRLDNKKIIKLALFLEILSDMFYEAILFLLITFYGC